jgi:uncharacterized protein (TIGR00369 family)
MKKIRNPFAGIEGYNCFGCSPDNPFGLKMNFTEEGEFLISEWQPSSHLQGYLNVLHGGIQVTLMDEIASWTVYVKAKTGGVTSSLNVDFIKPVFINKGPITLKSKLIKSDGRNATVFVELFNKENIVCARSTIDYYIYPEEIARQRFYYPGHNNFYFE